jgi:hypothetical protein
MRTASGPNPSVACRGVRTIIRERNATVKAVTGRPIVRSRDGVSLSSVSALRSRNRKRGS